MAKKQLELPLCVPCREELKKEGREVELVQHRIAGKVKCAVCGRMRYGDTYYVGRVEA